MIGMRLWYYFIIIVDHLPSLKEIKKIRSHLMVVTVVRVVSFLRDGRDIPN